MRIYLLDPGLTHRRGHDFAHAVAIARECQNRSIPFEVLGTSDATDEIVERLGCRRLFQVDRWSKPHWKLARRVAWSATAVYVAQSQQYCRELRSALTGRITPADVILLGAANCSFLAGYARWLASIPLNARPHSAILLRYSAAEGLDRRRLRQLSRLLSKRWLDRIRRLAPGKTLIGTDTILVAREFEELLGCRTAFLPLPLTAPPARPRQSEARPVNLVFLGDARPEKGFDLLPDALAKALGRFPELCATIQVTKPKKNQLPMIARLRRLAPRVQLIESVLEDQDFYRHLSDSDAVLLPYDPAKYAKRSSQILVEAASLARPVIATCGTFLEREMARLGIAGVLCQRFDSDALADAVTSFVTNRADLLDQAWRRTGALRKVHTAEAFVDKLVQLATVGASIPDDGTCTPTEISWPA